MTLREEIALSMARVRLEFVLRRLYVLPKFEMPVIMLKSAGNFDAVYRHMEQVMYVARNDVKIHALERRADVAHARWRMYTPDTSNARSMNELADSIRFVVRHSRILSVHRSPMQFNNASSVLGSRQLRLEHGSAAVEVKGEEEVREEIPLYAYFPETFLEEYVEYLESLGLHLVVSASPASMTQSSFGGESKSGGRGGPGGTGVVRRVRASREGVFAASGNAGLSVAAEGSYMVEGGVRFPTSTLFMQHVYRGGIVLLELGFRDVFIRLNMFGMQSSRMGLTSRSRGTERDAEKRQVALDFSSLRSKLHSNSFSYDFHCRQFHKYVAAPEHVFPGSLDMLEVLNNTAEYYRARPMYARDVVEFHQVRVVLEPGIEPEELFRYIVERADRYGVRDLGGYRDLDRPAIGWASDEGLVSAAEASGGLLSREAGWEFSFVALCLTRNVGLDSKSSPVWQGPSVRPDLERGHAASPVMVHTPGAESLKYGYTMGPSSFIAGAELRGGKRGGDGNGDGNGDGSSSSGWVKVGNVMLIPFYVTVVNVLDKRPLKVAWEEEKHVRMMSGVVERVRGMLGRLVAQAKIHFLTDMYWEHLLSGGRMPKTEFQALMVLVWRRRFSELDPGLKAVLGKPRVPWPEFVGHVQALVSLSGPRLQVIWDEERGESHVFVFHVEAPQDVGAHIRIRASGSAEFYVVARDIALLAGGDGDGGDGDGDGLVRIDRLQRDLVTEVVNVVLHWMWKQQVS